MATITVKSEITGTVCKVLASEGEHIDEDGTILLIESMKMEIPAQTPCVGTIKSIHFAEGDSINEGDVIATIEAV